MRTILKVLYAPAMLIGFNAVAFGLAANGDSHLWLLPLLLAAIGTSFLVERIIPYDTSWNGDVNDRPGRGLRGRQRDFGLSFRRDDPAAALLSPTTGIWPVAWALWGQVLLAILAADFGITMCAYFSHRYEWLWRFHAVHHSVKRLYGFNGLMKHPLHQAIETAAGTLPLVLIGMPFDIGLLLGFAVAVQLLLHTPTPTCGSDHCATSSRFASVHRFHHQKWAGIGDVNYGLFTCIWDHILGTVAFDPARRFISDNLGIGKQPDYPVGYVAQLAAPFRPQPRQMPEPRALER